MGATYTGAVCMNLLRHPGWGRAQETYGEDPHHVGEMAAALTRGLQEHVMACMKHFACNSMEEARFRVDVTVDERALHEVYLPHFRRVADEGVASVMSAYNSVNGNWCGENSVLLTDILRDGVGVGRIRHLRFHRRAARPGPVGDRRPRDRDALPPAAGPAPSRRRGRRTARHGRCGGPGGGHGGHAAAVRPDLRWRAGPSVLASPDHRALAREAASASMVLLRNEGPLLPVDPQTCPGWRCSDVWPRCPTSATAGRAMSIRRRCRPCSTASGRLSRRPTWSTTPPTPWWPKAPICAWWWSAAPRTTRASSSTWGPASR